MGGYVMLFENYDSIDVIQHLGVQRLYSFDNGYGASIVTGPATYGHKQGLYEIAVLYKGSVCYSTFITDDVIGFATVERCEEVLQLIKDI